MDHFFGSVSTLMSRLLRFMIERTITDFVAFIEKHKDGNNYEGVYDIFKGLALPTIVNPIRIFLLPLEKQGNTYVDPKLEEILRSFNLIIDNIVNSVKDVNEIQSLVFKMEDGTPVKKLICMKLSDEIVLKSKERIKQATLNNSLGIPL